MGGLSKGHVLLLTVLEAGRSEIKAPVDLVCSERLLSGSQPYFLLCPHTAEKQGRSLDALLPFTRASLS